MPQGHTFLSQLVSVRSEALVLIAPMSKRAAQKRKSADAKMELALAEESLVNINRYLKEHPEETIRLWVQLSGKALAESASAEAAGSGATPRKVAKKATAEESSAPEPSPGSKIPHSRRKIRDLSQDMIRKVIHSMEPSLTPSVINIMDKSDELFPHKLYCMATQSQLDDRGFARDVDEFTDQAVSRYAEVGKGCLKDIPKAPSRTFDWQSHGIYTMKIDNGVCNRIQHAAGISATLPKPIRDHEKWKFESNWDEMGAVLMFEEGVSMMPISKLFEQVVGWPRNASETGLDAGTGDTAGDGDNIVVGSPGDGAHGEGAGAVPASSEAGHHPRWHRWVSKLPQFACRRAHAGMPSPLDGGNGCRSHWLPVR